MSLPRHFYMREFWKHYSAGFAKALGIASCSVLLTLLSLCIPAVRRWVLGQDASLSPLGRTVLTIFLAALCLVLLGFSIWLHFSWKRKYSDFRMRVYEKKVTDDELYPEMMKVVESMISAVELP